MAVVSIKHLFDAGAHLGHKTQKWHPKMKPFIFVEKNGIHIINLEETQKAIGNALEFLTEAYITKKDWGSAKKILRKILAINPESSIKNRLLFLISSCNVQADTPCPKVILPWERISDFW